MKHGSLALALVLALGLGFVSPALTQEEPPAPKEQPAPVPDPAKEPPAPAPDPAKEPPAEPPATPPADAPPAQAPATPPAAAPATPPAAAPATPSAAAPETPPAPTAPAPAAAAPAGATPAAAATKELTPCAKSFVPLAETYKKAYGEMQTWIAAIDSATAASSATIGEMQARIQQNETAITAARGAGDNKKAKALEKENKQLRSDIKAAEKQLSGVCSDFEKEAAQRIKKYADDSELALQIIKDRSR